MAYRSVSIDPLDLKKSTAVGVSIPFSNTSAFSPVYTTIKQVRYNLINYLLTDKREKLYYPNFGAGLRSQLFEQMTDNALDTLKENLRSDINQYFSSVVITQISITPSYDQNYFTLSLSYNIKNTGIEDQISLNLENGI